MRQKTRRSDLHWLPVRRRISFKIATVTFRVLQFQPPSYLASLIPRYVPARALRSSSSLLICVPHVKPPWQPPKHFHLLLRISGMHCQIICRPCQLFLLLEELSNITYFCLLTLTVVRNLVRSYIQLNVSHFVTAPTTAIAHPGNTMPPIYKRSIRAPTISG